MHSLQAEDKFWAKDSSGNKHLIIQYAEVVWSPSWNDLQLGRTGYKCFKTETGDTVIRIGISRFKIVSTGVELVALEDS
jgi:hypothetical protein